MYNTGPLKCIEMGYNGNENPARLWCHVFISQIWFPGLCSIRKDGSRNQVKASNLYTSDHVYAVIYLYTSLCVAVFTQDKLSFSLALGRRISRALGQGCAQVACYTRIWNICDCQLLFRGTCFNFPMECFQNFPFKHAYSLVTFS